MTRRKRPPSVRVLVRTKRARARENQQLIRKSVANAEKQASKSRGYMMWIPIISILVIVVLSLVFTMGPGMMLGGQ